MQRFYVKLCRADHVADIAPVKIDQICQQMLWHVLLYMVAKMHNCNHNIKTKHTVQP